MGRGTADMELQLYDIQFKPIGSDIERLYLGGDIDRRLAGFGIRCVSKQWATLLFRCESDRHKTLESITG